MSDEGKTILGWWGTHVGDRDSAAARGLAARLRRADPLAMLAEPMVHVLAQGLRTQDAGRLLRVVAVLAHVREHVPERLMRRLGGDEPTLSALRFQRLIRSTPDEIAGAVIRALPLADRACNVAALGEDLWWWGERVQDRWCFEYVGAVLPQRTADPNPRETDFQETLA